MWKCAFWSEKSIPYNNFVFGSPSFNNFPVVKSDIILIFPGWGWRPPVVGGGCQVEDRVGLELEASDTQRWVTSLSLSFLIFNQRRQRWCWLSSEGVDGQLRRHRECSGPPLAHGEPSTGGSPSTQLGSRHPSLGLCYYLRLGLTLCLFWQNTLSFLLCWKRTRHKAAKYLLSTYVLL